MSRYPNTVGLANRALAKKTERVNAEANRELTLFVKGTFGDIYAVTQTHEFDPILGWTMQIENVSHPAPVSLSSDGLFRGLALGLYEVIPASEGRHAQEKARS
jgi:hypothetical protein